MKLFQIEEPDGSPVDPDLPGIAVGIDIGGIATEVAVAVGGNAAILADRDGLALDLAVPPAGATTETWRALLEGVRVRAERALAQPVTHAVVVTASPADAAFETGLAAAAEAAGLILLRLVTRSDFGGGQQPALAAAVLAEDLAPRPKAL